MMSELVTPQCVPRMGNLSSATISPLTGWLSHQTISVDSDKLLAIFAANLQRRMDANPAWDSDHKIESATNGGVTKSSVYRYRKAQSYPNLKQIALLAKLFRCPPWLLLVDPDAPLEDVLRNLMPPPSR